MDSLAGARELVFDLRRLGGNPGAFIAEITIPDGVSAKMEKYGRPGHYGLEGIDVPTLRAWITRVSLVDEGRK